ncbi:MAG: response regulator [Chloroflexi bacterium]|nr:response regulator [Chloroflexota bacterium]
MATPKAPQMAPKQMHRHTTASCSDAAAAACPDRSVDRRPGDERAPPAPSIYCLGDDPALRDLLVENLRRRGYEVLEVAAGGPTAMVAATPAAMPADRPPVAGPVPPAQSTSSLILVCELSRPEPACWAAAARVRVEYGAAVPLVLLSDAWPDRRRLAELEPCLYLRKPVAIGDVLEAIYCAERLESRGAAACRTAGDQER